MRGTVKKAICRSKNEVSSGWVVSDFYMDTRDNNPVRRIAYGENVDLRDLDGNAGCPRFLVDTKYCIRTRFT